MSHERGVRAICMTRTVIAKGTTYYIVGMIADRILDSTIADICAREYYSIRFTAGITLHLNKSVTNLVAFIAQQDTIGNSVSLRYIASSS